ncbi:efflux RND transporter periplasmic adaptor subunit [Acidithiobacillus sp. IBUN Pt1247-S3]|uniref:efflux RND transporter periplasmic adaptor subunit n=1 Tax=Acidithiobacillus sp. IBUN Pt1247-S3 TaxID=3166642 RepID=UPI0034E5C4BA
MIIVRRCCFWPFLIFLLTQTPAAFAAGIPVQVARVQSALSQTTMSALGEVRSRAEVTLAAPVTGRVLGPLRQDGPVRRGTLLAQIQAAGFSARIAAAQAQQGYAKDALQRDQKLFRDGVIARAQVDSARLAARQAQDALAALQQQSAQMQIQAPISGMLQYLVPVGATVAAGTPIARIDGRGRPWIQALVPPRLAQALTVGEPVMINDNGSDLTGTVRSVGQSARQSGLVAVLVDLPTQSRLLPGEWVTLHLPGKVSKKAHLEVPVDAIVMHGAQSFVWRIEKGRAQQVPVQVIAKNGDMVVIHALLRAGEQVVTRGNIRLSPGSAVTSLP